MSEASGRAPRFSPGDRVRIASRPVAGHCRTPFYLRGCPAVVIGVHGIYRDPERLAYHRTGLPALPLYKVRVAQADLEFARPGGAAWPGAPISLEGNDNIEADIYESWLEADPGA